MRGLQERVEEKENYKGEMQQDKRKRDGDERKDFSIWWAGREREREKGRRQGFLIFQGVFYDKDSEEREREREREREVSGCQVSEFGCYFSSAGFLLCPLVLAEK